MQKYLISSHVDYLWAHKGQLNIIFNLLNRNSQRKSSSVKFIAYFDSITKNCKIMEIFSHRVYKIHQRPLVHGKSLFSEIKIKKLNIYQFCSYNL